MRGWLVLLFVTWALRAGAQLPDVLQGPQHDGAFGWTFSIPDGWSGTRSEEGYVLVHGAEGVMIILMRKNYPDQEALRTDLSSPTDGTDIHMAIAEGPAEVAPGTWSATHLGSMQGMEVKTLTLATWDPNGSTATVVALAPLPLFDGSLEQALRSVHGSLHYGPVSGSSTSRSAPVRNDTEAAVDPYWTERLSGNRLTYMDSYSSPTGFPGDISGGYATTRRIDLCPQGFFTTNGSSEHTFGGDNVSAYGKERSAGEGRWQALRGADGRPLLRLRSNDGTVRDYHLENKEGATYLNRERWYRTNLERDGAEYAPNCP